MAAAKLFVGKLSYTTTDEELQTVFGAYGTVVSAKVIKDRDSGQSKGFAFVEMEKEEDAQAAIAALDGKEISGRTVVVNVARPQENRESRGGNNFRGGFQPRY